VREPRVVVHDDEQSLARAVAAELVSRLRSPGPHHLVVTGGGVGTLVLSELRSGSGGVDWDSVHVWWGDERFLPEDDPQRNETGARRALLDALPLRPEHVHAMPPDTGQGVVAAALTYADELAQHSTDGFVPDFDVLLLGMGPDGHIASLFPGQPAVHAAGSTVAVEASPKPPPTRVSLTFPAIRAAREVWIVAAGQAKAEAAAAAIRAGTSPDEVPAAAARGREETVFWLDRESARLT
jgi:6-phosphogluconolactonase